MHISRNRKQIIMNHIIGFYAVFKSHVFEHYLINCETLLIIIPHKTK